MMMKKMVMALIVAGCFSVFASGAVFAETAGTNPQATVNQGAQQEDAVLQKQKEIDQYVFEQHKADLEKQGITVTHTAPQGGYVEIGITPYNEDNANYLYDIFGKDNVKVVEGVQAVTLGETTTAAKSAAAAETAPAAGSESSSSNVMVYVLSGIVVLGAAAVFVTRKLRVAKR